MDHQSALQLSFLMTVIITTFIVVFLTKHLIILIAEKRKKSKLSKMDLDNYEVLTSKDGYPKILQSKSDKNNLIYL